MVLEAPLAAASHAALGVWLGSVVFFSFVGAPTIFSALPRDAAGTAVNAIFPRYYLFGVGFGLSALAAALARGFLGRFDPPVTATAGLAALGVAGAAYARWVLIPRMEAAGDDAFDRYHRQSVVLNGVVMVAVAGALVASHL